LFNDERQRGKSLVEACKGVGEKTKNDSALMHKNVQAKIK